MFLLFLHYSYPGECWTLQTVSSISSMQYSGITQEMTNCAEERNPLCIRLRENNGNGKKKRQGNKKKNSLRWKQRKNKKSEKVGFTKKRRKGRSVEARQAGQGWDPIEVSNFTEMVGRSGAWVYILPNARTVGPGKIRICLGKIRIFEVYS